MPGLTDKLSDTQFQDAIVVLRRLRLLTGESQGPDKSIDAHPLIREYFGNLLQRKYPEEYRGAHRRLYEYLRTSAQERPDSLPDMEELFEAVVHGCKAGRHKEVLDEVYLPRIMRHPDLFAADILGALVPLVSVLSHFFHPESWDEPVPQSTPGGPGLPENDQLHVLIDSGRYLTATRGYAADEVFKAYTKAKKMCERIGTPKQMIEAVYGLWRCYLVRADLRETVKLAQELEQRVAGLGDDYKLIAKRTLAVSFYFRGDFRTALATATEGVRLDATAPDPSELGVLRGEVAVTSRCYKALSQWLLGDRKLAGVESDAAIALARRYGHPHTLALALFLDGWLRQLEEDSARVLEQSDELRSLSDGKGLALWSAGATWQHGWAQHHQGLRREGLEEMKAGLEAWEETGAQLITPFWLYHLACAHTGQDIHEALKYIDRALDMVERRGERMWESPLLRLKGELLIAVDRSSVKQAQQCFTKALDRARAQNAPWLIDAAEQCLAAYPLPNRLRALTTPSFPHAVALEPSLHDATEYQFVAGDRRLVVRYAKADDAPSDITTTAMAYAEQCELFLDAQNVIVSTPFRTTHEATAVTMSAELSTGPMQAALLRFDSGTLVELNLAAGPADLGVKAELARLLASVRLAKIAPQTAIARAIAAGPRGSNRYPIGPVTLDIPPVYSAPFVFVLATPDGGERYTIERTQSENATILRGPATVPFLAHHGVMTAISADGQQVRFEPPVPRETSDENRGDSHVSTNVTRGGSARVVADGTIHGTPVCVSFAGPAASAELAKQLLAALNAVQ